MDAFQPIVHSICETSTLYCDPATACMVAFNSIMLFIMGIVLRNILNTLENEYCRQIHFFHLQIEQYTDINQNFFENTFPIPPTDSEMIPTQRLTLTSETEKFEEYLSQTIQKHSNEAKDPNLKSLRVKPKKKVDVKEDLCVLIQYSLLLAGILRNSSTETESLFDYSKLLEPITDDQLLNKLIMIFTSALSFYLSDMSSMILRVKECGDPLLFIHHLVTIELLFLHLILEQQKLELLCI